MTDERRVSHMAQCVQCEAPRTPWSFTTYEERATWVGQHRVKTGHAVKQWLEVL